MEMAPVCGFLVLLWWQSAPDSISGMASHLNYSNSADGQNQGGSGSHDVSTVWYNSSVIGDKIEGLSESQINDELSDWER